MLFALGLGPNVVGVTRFCRYPAEASNLAKVGGFYDVALEAIWSLKPSLVVSLEEGADLSSSAGQLGFSFLKVDHRSVRGIKQSLLDLGAICGVPEKAARIIHTMQEEEREIAARVAAAPRYRVLVVVGRLHDRGVASSLFVSGADGYYTDILAMIGSENVNQSVTVAVPTLSAEGLLALNPDVILEIRNQDDPHPESNVDKLWNAYPTITAVKQHRVFALSDDFASIPGVRYPRLAREIARRIHPARFVDLEQGK
jgi:iron complex transport system substrate-binding protein